MIDCNYIKRIVIILLTIIIFVGFKNARAQGEIDITQEMARYKRIMDAPIGTATWLGTTGLGKETEEELIFYLRRELGAAYGDTNIFASDLIYLGIFIENTNKVYYWKVNWADYKDSEYYAIISTNASGIESIGLTENPPPK